MAVKIKDFKLPLQLLAVLIFSVVFGPILPETVKSFLFAVSITIKECLIFSLPFLIFSFLFTSLGHLKNNALFFAALLIALICLSNFTSTMTSYGIGRFTLETIAVPCVPKDFDHPLMALWNFKLPKLISNDMALFIGFITGLIATFKFPHLQKSWGQHLLKGSYFLLRKVFVPLMPIFILGFSLKLQNDQILNVILLEYPKVLMIMALVCFGYIFILYSIFSKLNLSKATKSISNMSSPMLAGFSTMSSAAAMPLTILASEKNVERREIVDVVVPATVNIHLIGDCFSITFFALAVMVSFGQGIPDLSTFLIFAAYVVLAKFSVAAVPGGGVLVLVPLLEQHLGLSSSMSSLVTTLYVIFDPIITSANVLGNGAFVIGFSKIYQKFERYLKG